MTVTKKQIPAAVKEVAATLDQYDFDAIVVVWRVSPRKWFVGIHSNVRNVEIGESYTSDLGGGATVFERAA